MKKDDQSDIAKWAIARWALRYSIQPDRVHTVIHRALETEVRRVQKAAARSKWPKNKGGRPDKSTPGYNPDDRWRPLADGESAGDRRTISTGGQVFVEDFKAWRDTEVARAKAGIRNTKARDYAARAARKRVRDFEKLVEKFDAPSLRALPGRESEAAMRAVRDYIKGLPSGVEGIAAMFDPQPRARAAIRKKKATNPKRGTG